MKNEQTRMKVLFLTNIPSPYRVDFFQELGRLCDLTVLYELKSASDRDGAWRRTIQEKSYHEIFLKSTIRQISSAWCPSVVRYLKAGIYDIIVVGAYSTPTGMQAIAYMKRKRIPYWISCDGAVADGKSGTKYKIKKYFLSGAAGYLSSAKLCDEYLLYYGAEKSRIYHYPFTSVMQKDILEEPLTEREKRKIRSDLRIEEAFVFLTVGQFIHRKGYDILLKAAHQLEKSTGVYIVGGKPTEEYTMLKENLGLENVHFVGFQGKEKLQQYYRAADVFVFPTREDIWGLVINEAMANGLPVITTDKCVAGMELVKENGKLILAESVEELQSVMKSYEEAEKKDLQEEAKKSLEIIKEYSIENMAEGYFNAFAEQGYEKE